MFLSLTINLIKNISTNLIERLDIGSITHIMFIIGCCSFKSPDSYWDCSHIHFVRQLTVSECSPNLDSYRDA